MNASGSRASRAGRPALSRERVLSAALELADAEGLAGVTMRRLAPLLGVEAMSLYHHVPGKEALLDAMADAVVAEVVEAVALQADPGDDWPAALRGRCLTAREVILRHRWAPALLGSRSSIPPALFRYYDDVLGTMVAGGVSYHLAHRGLHSLGTMVLGFTAELFSPIREGGALDEDQADADFARMAATVPYLTAMVAAEVHDHGEDPLGWCDGQLEFEFTLGLVLDGLARAARA